MRLFLVLVAIFSVHAYGLVKKEHYGKLYTASAFNLTFNSAQKFCSDNGATLVKVDSLDEMNWIMDWINSNRISGSSYWTGAIKNVTDYKWSDGEDIVRGQWRRGYREKCTGSCCAMYVFAPRKEWVPTPCSSSYSTYAVCQGPSNRFLMKKLKQTVQSMAVRLEKVQKSLTSLQANNEVKERSLDGKIKKIARSLHDMNSAIVLQNEQFKDKLDTLQSLRSDSEAKERDLVIGMDEQNQRIRDVKSTFSAQNKDMTEKLEKFEHSLTRIQSRTAANESDLAAKIDELTRSLQDMNSVTFSLKEQFTDTLKMVQSLRSHSGANESGLSEKVDKLARTVHDMNSSISLQKVQVTDKHRGLSAKLDELVRSLQRRKARFHDAKDQLSDRDGNLGAKLDELARTVQDMNSTFSTQNRQMTEKLEKFEHSLILLQSRTEASESDFGAKMDKSNRNVQDTNSAFLGLRGSRQIQIQIWALAGVLLVSVVFGTAALLILRQKILVTRESGHSFQLKNFSHMY